MKMKVTKEKQSKKNVKLHFEVASEEADCTIESLWAIPKGKGRFKIDNIPFYIKNFALNDIVSAKELHGCLYAQKLLEASKHSTIRIWFSNEKYVQPTGDGLLAMGCDYEVSDLSRLIAVDIPPNISYEGIKSYLDSGIKKNILDYEESCRGFHLPSKLRKS